MAVPEKQFNIFFFGLTEFVNYAYPKLIYLQSKETLWVLRDAFNAFANRAVLDQDALVR